MRLAHLVVACSPFGYPCTGAVLETHLSFTMCKGDLPYTMARSIRGQKATKGLHPTAEPVRSGETLADSATLESPLSFLDLYIDPTDPRYNAGPTATAGWRGRRWRRWWRWWRWRRWRRWRRWWRWGRSRSRTALVGSSISSEKGLQPLMKHIVLTMLAWEGSGCVAECIDHVFLNVG